MQNKKQIEIDSGVIEQIMDMARDLAEQKGYDFPHSTFNSSDTPYIDKAIGVLQERGVVPMTDEEAHHMDGFNQSA